MTDKTREEYLKTKKGKEAQEKAQEKYERENPEKRRIQKRDYMRRRREENPKYGND